jgi:NRAMP (natural resistance-associated macrophage protein)-like metal ion transporter
MVTRNPALVSSQDGAEYPVLASARTIRRMAPGILIAAGYVDPGNWATDLAAGSRYEYALLAVVVGCGLAAMLFQLMSARLGLAAGMDLAVATRQAWPRAAPFLWMAAEAAIVSTDLAEVLGSAMALHLLFGIPLVLGVALTGFDVAILMALESGRTGLLERAVAGMVLLVGAGLAYEILLARPVPLDVMRGAVPTARLLRDHGMLAVSVGILGATIMPHNLYLHSHLVRSGGREWAMGEEQAELRRVRVDTVRSLAIATLMNAALVVLAARVFYATGHEVADIEEAQRLIGADCLWRGAARRGPERDDHGNARRPGRHGRLPPDALEAVAAPLDHPRVRHRPSALRGSAVGRRQRRPSARRLSDRPQSGAAGCHHTARAFHFRPTEDGGLRQPAVAQSPRVDGRSRRDRGGPGAFRLGARLAGPVVPASWNEARVSRRPASPRGGAGDDSTAKGQ